MKLDLAARLNFDSVQFDQDNDVHLVVSLKAPKIDWQAKRPRVCVIPVIDVSPSMSGQKLDYAKQSVLKLIDHLQPGDFCGVVAFGGEVFTVSKPVEVTQAQKDELKAKIGQLGVNGSTNFSGGMCQGLELLNKGDLPADMLKRVIMFTDGMPNTGIAITRADIVKLLESQLGIATLSAFGYGADADQELLADVAKTGKGNYAFIKNPEDALSAFAKELGGLLSTFAQNLIIEVAPHNGHTISETISDVTAKEDGKKVQVTLSDILSEEERHIVFAVKLDKQPNAFPRESSVFDVKVEFDALDGTQQKQHLVEELKVKVHFVKAGDAQAKPTPDVDKLVGLAQLVKAQIEAEELAKRGNYAQAVRMMDETSSDYASRGLGDLAKVSLNVGSKMGSSAQYSASTGYLSSMKSAGSRSYGTSHMDDEASMDLSGAGVVLSNSAQVQMAADFGRGTADMAGGSWSVQGGPSAPNVIVAPSIVVNPAPVIFKPAPAPAAKPVSKKPQAVVSKVSKQKSKRW